MGSSLGVLAAQREGEAGILAHLLADESLLYTKTKNYYRDAVGHDFKDLPEVLGSQSKRLEETIHEVVERARALEGIVPRILARFLGHPRLDARAEEDADARAMIASLLAEHKAIIRSLRVDPEMVSAKGRNMEIDDFLKRLMEEHQEAVWMLCSLMAEQLAPPAPDGAAKHPGLPTSACSAGNGVVPLSRRDRRISTTPGLGIG